MLHPGNIYAMKYAIDHLPGDEPVIEIGSFSGLSANVISYFLRKYHRTNKMFCSGKWIFEGAERGVYLGDRDILHSDYRTYVMENFKRNIDMFSPNKPYPIEMFSDDFFLKWAENAHMTYIFGRTVQLGGRISFSYIDGNHTYDYTKRDFENVDRYLVPGGFILFDDSSDIDQFGLTRLMQEIRKDSRYRLIMKNPNYSFQKVN